MRETAMDEVTEGTTNTERKMMRIFVGAIDEYDVAWGVDDSGVLRSTRLSNGCREATRTVT